MDNKFTRTCIKSRTIIVTKTILPLYGLIVVQNNYLRPQGNQDVCNGCKLIINMCIIIIFIVQKGSKLKFCKEILDDNNLVTWNMFLVINKLEFKQEPSLINNIIVISLLNNPSSLHNHR